MGGVIEQMQAQLDRIEAAVARLAKCPAAPAGMHPQKGSPLGARKHRDAVKRRVAEATARGVAPIELGAAIDGEKYYLSEESLAEELGERTRLSLSKVKEAAPAANDTDSTTPEEEAAFHTALARGRRARGDRQ